jgi:uncharacterized protein YjbJ (UPF0337 family)/vacuolar-type H+-ATPase subunit H
MSGSSAYYGSGSGSSTEYQGPQFQSQQEYGNGQRHGSNPIAKAADAVKGTVEDVTGDLKERVGDMSNEIKDRVGDVKERLGEAVGGMRQQAGQMGQQSQRSMSRAGYQMEEWQQRARYQGQRRGQQVMRNLEDNPLTYGAVALAAGAALALLLPQTRYENRAFGEMRDQVMERGQEALETAKSQASQVVSEIRPELEEKARQIVSDAKEIGKEVVKDAADELRPVVDKAVAKGKEGAANTAKEMGVDPNKLTGSSSGSGGTALNRDTMRGQWKQIRGDVKSKWGQLTDDELTTIEGDYDKLAGAIQKRYGFERSRAENEINDFFNSRKA